MGLRDMVSHLELSQNGYNIIAFLMISFRLFAWSETQLRGSSPYFVSSIKKYVFYAFACVGCTTLD